LGRQDCAQVLQQNLAEEKAADEKFTPLPKMRSIGQRPEGPGRSWLESTGWRWSSHR
jgi:hypothetical protein